MATSSIDDDLAGARAAIVEQVTAALRRVDSALVSDPYIEAEFVAQVERILGQTVAALGLLPPTERSQPSRGAEVGEHRARQNVHPVDSLRAATLLFDVSLGILVDAAGDRVGHDQIARALNASIMGNVIPASVAYVNVLLERLAVAHSEERLGISRELHDRVAHSIAAGMQRVDLSGLSDAAGTPSQARLAEGMALFDAALDETRAIARDLRHFVGDKRLDEALNDYVADLDGAGPPVVVQLDGTPFRLSTGTQEEAFIIVREAIHNARRHSHADRITVRSSWRPESVLLSVEDDGHGFEHDRIRSGALGLVAAQERAELIGADLTIDPGLGLGTHVELVIPVQEAGA